MGREGTPRRPNSQEINTQRSEPEVKNERSSAKDGALEKLRCGII